MRSLFICVLVIGMNAAVAQKLPNIQETPVTAPPNLKIDGKTTEWDHAFQAYNKATLVYYTVAHNTANLILVVQARDQAIIDKILKGGITFTVNSTGKKEAKGMPAITFPLPGQSKAPGIAAKQLAAGPTAGDNMGRPFSSIQADSVMYSMNRKYIDQLKDLAVSGVAAISHAAISIYNDYGIKAAALFDQQKALTLELAVPLAYFNLESTGSAEFAYQVRLNGLEAQQKLIANGNSVVEAKLTAEISSMSASFSATDFWGKYVLINNR